ncbi:chitobiase/beta-hexosaminidase C-terminal domain-containing protein [Cohnella fermenti]|nr:chitobiase/beta-hexosaminidase C-terminal domain-containing protein [Cohnella fermenti]
MKVLKLMKPAALWLFSVSLVVGSAAASIGRMQTANAAPDTPATVLTVDASTIVAPLKKEMRGTNIGLWTSSSFYPVSSRSQQYVNMIKEAGISLIRFPAGAEADYAYWDRTNASPWYEAPSPYTRTITADMLDSYMSLVREVGAEPFITVNAKFDDKAMAADMVRYANVEKGYGIKYWEIGNEPEFFAAPDNVTPLEYAARIKEYSDAMKAVDPSIVIVGPANAQPTQFEDWTKPILSYLNDNGSPVNAISTHWYPLWGGQTNTASSSYPSIDNLLAFDGPDYANSYISWANKFTDTTPTDNLVSYRDTYTDNALIGITELGQVTGGEEGAGIGNTMAGALWLGDVIGRLAYHQVDFLTQFLLQGGQAYALMDDNKNVRPAYYLYPMLKRYFGDQMVQSASGDDQNFTIWATKRTGEDDKLYLMVINKNQTESLPAEIDLSGFAPEATASSWVLNAPSINSVSGASINGMQIGADGTLPDISGNIVSGVSDSFTQAYPAHSVTMIELTRAGSAQQKPARFLGQYAEGVNERKTATDWPGTVGDTPQGWGKIYRTATASWNVNLPAEAEYTFSIRAYGEGDAPSFQVKLDGEPVPDATFAAGSGWQTYEGGLGTVAAGPHTFEVYNNSAAGQTNIDIAYADIAGAAPGAFGLTAPADGATVPSTIVTLDWKQSVGSLAYAPQGADNYTLIVADNPQLTNPVLHTTVQSTSYELNSLDGEKTYYWTVIASNANGATQADSLYSFTTPELVVPDSPARYPGRFASGMNERKQPTDYPGSAEQTPLGWGKLWRTATAEWPVYIPVTGQYDFVLRAFGEGESPSFQVKIDGQNVTNGTFSPGTSWGSYSGSFGTIPAGLHFVQITNNSASGVTNIGIAHIDILGAAPGKFGLTSPVNQSNAYSTTVTLDWTQNDNGGPHAPFGAESYKVLVADNAAFNNPTVDATVTGTTYQADNLQPDTDYYWTVIAANANGTTRAVSPFKFTTPSHYVPVGPARYFAQFADAINERRTSANYPGTASETPQGWGKIYRTATGTWTVNFPAAGTYAFTVRAYGEGSTAHFQAQLDGQTLPNTDFAPGAAWSDYSGNVTVDEAGNHTFGLLNDSATAGHNIDVAYIDFMGAAPAPFSLTAPADNELINVPSVTLDWTQHLGDLTYSPQGAADYTVFVADDAQFEHIVAQATTSATTHTFEHLPSLTTYYWQVTATNANGSLASTQTFRFSTGDYVQPSLATLTGPTSALVGQSLDFDIGVSIASLQSDGTAAEPNFSPPGGTYTAAQTVSIASATPGAEIRYTVDGSTPTATSALYTGPIQVSETKTLTAIAFKSGMSASTAAAATYTISLPPSEPVGYTYCASEFGTCAFDGTASVAFGASGSYYYGTFTDSVVCSTGNFGGDPAYNKAKKCYYNLQDETQEVAVLSYGQPNDALTSASDGLGGLFSIMEAIVDYDPAYIQFATETNLDGDLVLSDQAIGNLKPGFQVLATGVKPLEGELYIVIARTEATEPVNGTMFALHGNVRPDLSASGNTVVALAKADVSNDGDMTELGVGSASIQLHVALADKNALEAVIASANQLIAAAVPGAAPGQYPANAIVTFQAAISAAIAVKNDPNASQSAVSAATAALQAAMQAFSGSVVPPALADKTALQQTAQRVQTKLAAASTGTKIGQYPASAIQTLQQALQAAQAVLQASGTTQTQADDAVSALNGAWNDFAAQIVSLIPGQGAVTIRDLSILAKYYGITSDDTEHWSYVDKADLFGSGSISIVELAAVARMIVSQWLEQ